jgi:hypothetical protein
VNNKFCMITTGRSGSTALMNAIAARAGVVVPAVDLECDDHELVHRQRFAAATQVYAKLIGAPVNSASELIDAFFTVHAHARWAGFKILPEQHSDLREFVSREDIQFITLARRDVVGTCASFMLAMEKNTWRRSGGAPVRTWTFSEENRQRVEGNLRYIHSSLRVLQQVPHAIAVFYEDLCEPGYEHPALNSYFDTKLVFANPQRPVAAADYVTNWSEFTQFCADHWKQLVQGPAKQR